MRRRAVLLLTVMTAALVTVASPAWATTFTVDSTANAGDANLNDNACDANPLPHVQLCTLRAAIQEANDTPGADTINFQIGGAGVETISPNSALPQITEAVTIDGYTQPGASENTLAQGTNAALRIELRGPGTDSSTVGSMEGLDINAPNVVVKGLVINNFSRNGIDISGAGAVIEGNFLGTDPLGDSDQGSRFGGVNIALTSDVTIGGTAPEARNLISGNNSDGVNISNSTGVEVLGNLIGTRANGTSDLGNGGAGVRIGGDGNTIGDDVPSDGATNAANTIAFNDRDGISVFRDGNRILRNFIFSNNQDGVRIVNGGTGNAIHSNSIFDNGSAVGDLGIDLSGDGPTPNDPQDPDTGDNNLQNKPALRSAITSSGTTTVEGRLNSSPLETFRIQFFSNPSGNEGKKFIGQKSVTTNANGNTGTFTFSPNQVVPVGERITATATDPGGNTSEFSQAVAVV